MTLKDVKVRMIERDIRQIDLARQYGCSQQAVYNFLTGKSRSRGLAHFIAQRLDLPTETMIAENGDPPSSMDDLGIGR